MKIAIDGRVLSEQAGKAVYTRSLLLAWRAFSEHQFNVYGHMPTPGESWPANWIFRPLNSRGDRLRAFRRLDEDVLFSPSSYLTTLLSNRPTLTTIHDLVIYKVPVKLPLKTVLAEKFLLKQAVQRSRALVVQTESVRQDLAEFFPRSQTKTHVVAPGVTPTLSRSTLPSATDQQERLRQLGLNGRFLLFVGTVEPRKNLVRLIQSYQALPAEIRSGYQLVLAGKIGWADARLKKVLRHIPPGVVVTGRVDDQTLATLYEHSTLVVYPSLYEGVGYPILEGYYWSKPVITANRSSTAEVGRDAALLVDPESVSALTEALQKIIGDPTLAARLAAAGREKLQGYSWDKAAHQTLEILETIA